MIMKTKVKKSKICPDCGGHHYEDPVVIKLPESSMKKTGQMFARLEIFFKGIHDFVERGLDEQKMSEKTQKIEKGGHSKPPVTNVQRPKPTPNPPVKKSIT